MVDVDEQLGGRICGACGSPAATTAKFCAECGARLEPAPETPELRKLVSLLFCDLVGSTALGERLDPEAFRRVQLRYYATCEEALHRHRGTIEKFIGDAVMCVFGIPIAYEDDAHRACRAALDLIAGIEALNVELEEVWGVRLVVRIGVNTGVGIVGDPSGGRALVTGDPVNTAARLEQAAGPGEVLIGATTRELIGDEGVCVAVPPLELKGKGGRVPRLAAPRHEHGAFRTGGEGVRDRADRTRGRVAPDRVLARERGGGAERWLVSDPRAARNREVAARGGDRGKDDAGRLLGPMPSLRGSDHVPPPRRVARRAR